MKVIVDDKIPYIREPLAQLGIETVYLPGNEIGHEACQDADALIVRTRTRCDAQLLEGTQVKLVITATIGFDHINTADMQSLGVHWTNCPGCNASSVCQYIECCLLLISQKEGRPIDSFTLGIFGHGHVGSLVATMARRHGMRTIVSDPPLGMDCQAEIEREADIITFHVPLTKDGLCPTFHLANADFFGRLGRKPWLINTSRGPVVDNVALSKALDKGTIRQAIIDTWENEPAIDPILLNNVYIGTPHIAGYSADGKANATNMSVRALCRFFALPYPGDALPPELPAEKILRYKSTNNPLDLYNPFSDSERLKANPQDFERQRGDYPLRREP